MTRRWPDTLPGIIEPGFDLSPVDQSIRSDMEVGPKRLRRISVARADTVKAGWKLTDREMAAFRAWHGDEAWSLAGASDDVTGWAETNAAVTADAVAGPALQLADMIVEDMSSGQHRIDRTLTGPLDGDEVALVASLQAAGRSAVRIGLLDRAGVFQSVDLNLASGALTAVEAAILSCEASARGASWWRVILRVEAGTGIDDPKFRITLKDGSGNTTYTGDGSSGVSICEVNARVATGYDLFLATDADGNAVGAAGGSAWFQMPLPLGGGFGTVEARFEAPFSAKVLSGLGWHVTGQLEVRNA